MIQVCLLEATFAKRNIVHRIVECRKLKLLTWTPREHPALATDPSVSPCHPAAQFASPHPLCSYQSLWIKIADLNWCNLYSAINVQEIMRNSLYYGAVRLQYVCSSSLHITGAKRNTDYDRYNKYFEVLLPIRLVVDGHGPHFASALH